MLHIAPPEMSEALMVAALAILGLPVLDAIVKSVLSNPAAGGKKALAT
jgi:hypothetical protein